MEIEVKIDEKCNGPKIIIVTNKMDEQINEIITKLSEKKSKLITVFKDENIKLLDPTDIYRIYSSNGKVLVETKNDIFNVKSRLYEMEQKMDKEKFVRISNSELINLKKVKELDINIAGTIKITFLNETTTYVSRRLVSKIKQLLELWGQSNE